MRKALLFIGLVLMLPVVMGVGLGPGLFDDSGGGSTLNFYKEEFTNDDTVTAGDCAEWNADAMITTSCSSPKTMWFVPSNMTLTDIRFYIVATNTLGATEACDVSLEKGVATDLTNETATLETIQIGGTSSITTTGDSEIDCCSGISVDGGEWLRVTFDHTVASCNAVNSIRHVVTGTLIETP